MKAAAIIQARLTSKRLPGKVLKKISSYSVIELIYLRLKRSKLISKIIFAIPDNRENDELYSYLNNILGVDVYRGDENDVLSRYVQASNSYNADYYIRITADCPLICPEIIDKLLVESEKNSFDYISNVDPPMYPDGMDAEVFSKKALSWLDENVKKIEMREHVTYALRKLSREDKIKTDLNIGEFLPDRVSTAWMRLTLDNLEDLNMFFKLTEYTNDLENISLYEIEELYKNLKLYEINCH